MSSENLNLEKIASEWFKWVHDLRQTVLFLSFLHLVFFLLLLKIKHSGVLPSYFLIHTFICMMHFILNIKLDVPLPYLFSLELFSFFFPERDSYFIFASTPYDFHGFLYSLFFFSTFFFNSIAVKLKSHSFLKGWWIAGGLEEEWKLFNDIFNKCRYLPKVKKITLFLFPCGENIPVIIMQTINFLTYHLYVFSIIEINI